MSAVKDFMTLALRTFTIIIYRRSQINNHGGLQMYMESFKSHYGLLQYGINYKSKSVYNFVPGDKFYRHFTTVIYDQNQIS